MLGHFITPYPTIWGYLWKSLTRHETLACICMGYLLNNITDAQNKLTPWFQNPRRAKKIKFVKGRSVFEGQLKMELMSWNVIGKNTTPNLIKLISFSKNLRCSRTLQTYGVPQLGLIKTSPLILERLQMDWFPNTSVTQFATSNSVTWRNENCCFIYINLKKLLHLTF
jgi:hypothetical protein